MIIIICLRARRPGFQSQQRHSGIFRLLPRVGVLCIQ
jgi:hypothetical protein